jgi:excisionase family DNA binding protein
MNDALLKPRQVAQVLAIGRTKAYALIAAGVIPSIRLGGLIRVPRAALDDWIARQVKGGQEVAAK